MRTRELTTDSVAQKLRPSAKTVFLTGFAFFWIAFGLLLATRLLIIQDVASAEPIARTLALPGFGLGAAGSVMIAGVAIYVSRRQGDV